MDVGHRKMRELLEAFKQGQLDAEATDRLLTHLGGCAACRAEVAETKSIRPPLGRVDPQPSDTRPIPPLEVGESAAQVACADSRPRTPRGAWTLSVGAIVVALAGTGLGYLAGSSSSIDVVPREHVALRVTTPEVQASAVATPHTWGMEITLDAGGFTSGEVYRVVVRDDAGRTFDAGQFLGTGENSMRCNLNSSLLRASATGFDVLDDQGTVVVQGDL